MKRKKMMSLLLSAVAAVSMIAGCGNQAAGTSGEGNAPTSESREAGTDAAVIRQKSVCSCTTVRQKYGWYRGVFKASSLF